MVTWQEIDSFEDGSLSEYDLADSTEFSADTGLTGVTDGSYAAHLLGSASGTEYVRVSESGLSSYPAEGDSFRYDFTLSGTEEWPKFYFATDSSTSAGYAIEMDAGGQWSSTGIILHKYSDWDNGSRTTLGESRFPITLGDTYTLTCDWQAGGTFDISVTDSTDTEVGTLTASDSGTPYTSGGIGFGMFDESLGSSAPVIDNIEHGTEPVAQSAAVDSASLGGSLFSPSISETAAPQTATIASGDTTVSALSVSSSGLTTVPVSVVSAVPSGKDVTATAGSVSASAGSGAVSVSGASVSATVGGQNATVGLVSGVLAGSGPSATAGSVSATVGPAQTAGSLYSPSISESAPPQTASVSLVSAVPSGKDVTATAGSVSASVSPASVSGSLFSPTIGSGVSVSITPATASVSGYGVSGVLGTEIVSPVLGVVSVAGVAGTATPGAVTRSTEAAGASVAGVDATASPGGVVSTPATGGLTAGSQPLSAAAGGVVVASEAGAGNVSGSPILAVPGAVGTQAEVGAVTVVGRSVFGDGQLLVTMGAGGVSVSAIESSAIPGPVASTVERGSASVGGLGVADAIPGKSTFVPESAGGAGAHTQSEMLPGPVSGTVGVSSVSVSSADPAMDWRNDVVSDPAEVAVVSPGFGLRWTDNYERVVDVLGLVGDEKAVLGIVIDEVELLGTARDRYDVLGEL